MCALVPFGGLIFTCGCPGCSVKIEARVLATKKTSRTDSTKTDLEVVQRHLDFTFGRSGMNQLTRKAELIDLGFLP